FVPLPQISKHMIDATIAAEDERFYQHGALDLRGLTRAAAINLFHPGSIQQGGSTITQQLARNAPQFHVGRERTFARKIREAMVAQRIEQSLGKDEIMELYLNQVYYGAGAYGVEAAARTYFSKPALKLTLPEAAFLAGLP